MLIYNDRSLNDLREAVTNLVKVGEREFEVNVEVAGTWFCVDVRPLPIAEIAIDCKSPEVP